MRLSRFSTRTDRPVIARRRGVVCRAVRSFGQLARRVPWVFVASGACFVAFGFDAWRPLGFLVAGAVLALAEVAGDRAS